MNDEPNTEPQTLLNRREALGAFGALAASLALPGCQHGNACVVTPRQVEGPYFLDTGLGRRDITQGRPGASLRVELRVVESATCAPLSGVTVELWHADASGSYSGFDVVDGNLADHAGQTFLRGHQRTDPAGDVVFDTIFPGWYPGRPPHLHISLLLQDARRVTTQLYFDDALAQRVYALNPYTARGLHDTSNDEDRVSRQGSGPGPDPLLMRVEEVSGGLLAHYTLGVA